MRFHRSRAISDPPGALRTRFRVPAGFGIVLRIAIAYRASVSERDMGTQPLDTLMIAWGLSNHDLVETSPEQLTHKQVRRARTGRMLTLKMMMKVNRTFNVAIWKRLNEEQKEAFVEYGHKDLFSYAKGHEEGTADPNAELAEVIKNSRR